MRAIVCLLSSLMLLCSSSSAMAQGVAQSTLEKVREYRAIYIGYRESSVPFSYMVGDEPMGYSIDICDHLVEAVKEAVDDPAIRIVKVPVTTSSRFLMLQSGIIDLECGSTTNTRIRQQQVAFGLTTFVSGVKAVVRKESPIMGIADLDGKVVVTTSGTTTERIVRGVLNTRKLSARAKAARNHPESLAMVVASQADAFVIDEALLAGLVASSPEGSKVRFLEDNFGFEPYSVVLRRDDPELKKIVDKALREMMGSGQLERLYNKWFMAPIPPKGINLRIPMSNLLRGLIQNPNDEGN
ncbi:MAG: amino acid ABC transporter substrate-binding protein [Rhodocyclales bacterium]|nr:amino acid ABC transporter substrate-binding protein [Rhodocyclales bacterium]